MKEKIKKIILGDTLLILVAIIWGTTFIAQKVAMAEMSPFYFNGIRFLLGAGFLLFLFLFNYRKTPLNKKEIKKSFSFGMLAGLILTVAALLQQIGLVYTTSTKAGFITGFYVIFTPILAWFFAEKPKIEIWISAVILLIGFYLLSIQETSSLELGDSLQLLGAFFWAWHIIIIARVIKKINIIIFSFTQFFITGVISLIIAFLNQDPISWQIIGNNSGELLYAGILSVGIAYTLQVFGQRITPPSHVAIILSFEAVIAGIAGAVFLQEKLSFNQYLGCLLIFLGILFSQWVQVLRK